MGHSTRHAPYQWGVHWLTPILFINDFVIQFGGIASTGAVISAFERALGPDN